MVEMRPARNYERVEWPGITCVLHLDCGDVTSAEKGTKITRNTVANVSRVKGVGKEPLRAAPNQTAIALAVQRAAEE